MFLVFGDLRMADPFVYDKAKYHYSGDYPPDLPDEQAFVHTGFYLAWIIDRNRNLYSLSLVNTLRSRSRTSGRANGLARRSTSGVMERSSTKC